jgi:hypothetical protein
MAHDGRKGDGLMEIRIVAQEYCPRCGGGEEFNNRTKLGHEDGSWSWRCYNPACSLRYYNPDTGETEDEPTPEEQAASDARVAEWIGKIQFGKAKYFVGGVEVSKEEWRDQLDLGGPGEVVIG